ncbi:unnamed protein product [Polarella glacialis]|uniref:Uncharacterized protein n=1 Tax=Polarella glacialis TaxID=89957 RepID=A0A813DSV0_POLGL|nr:unnamed protein product [Polarella glacialis]
MVERSLKDSDRRTQLRQRGTSQSSLAPLGWSLNALFFLLLVCLLCVALLSLQRFTRPSLARFLSLLLVGDNSVPCNLAVFPGHYAAWCRAIMSPSSTGLQREIKDQSPPA